jgi:hypothetical protein
VLDGGNPLEFLSPHRRLPNDWPMCRRIGHSGLVVGSVEAVGTIGILEMLATDSESTSLDSTAAISKRDPGSNEVTDSLAVLVESAFQSVGSFDGS